MNRLKVAIAGGVVAASMFTGGLLGATIIGSWGRRCQCGDDCNSCGHLTRSGTRPTIHTE